MFDIFEIVRRKLRYITIECIVKYMKTPSFIEATSVSKVNRNAWVKQYDTFTM